MAYLFGIVENMKGSTRRLAKRVSPFINPSLSEIMLCKQDLWTSKP